jgi:hypothetical protein
MKHAVLLWAALASCGTPPPAAPGPDLTLLIEALGADDVDVRERAVQALVALGERVLPEIDRAIAGENDPEVAGRLRDVRGHLRGVSAELQFERTMIRDGEGFRWKARLVNGRNAAVLLVRPLQGSTTYRQFPVVDVEVEMPDGSIISGRRFQHERTGHINPPNVADMIVLGAGESVELFPGISPTEHKVPWFDSWAPPAGRYRARFVYDSTPENWLVWITDEPRALGGRNETLELPGLPVSLLETERLIDFAHVHHARIVSDWVGLAVE